MPLTERDIQAMLAAGEITPKGAENLRAKLMPDAGGTGVQGTGNTVATGGGTVVGRDLKIIIAGTSERLLRTIFGEHEASDEELRHTAETYLNHLVMKHRYLNFRGFGVSNIPLKLPLLKTYVPLKARVAMPDGDTWARKIRVAGRPVTEDEIAAMGELLCEPQSVLTLLQKNNGLIVLGDPGSGKSTFLKSLALRLALGDTDDLGLGERFPILVPLSDYATALVDGDMPLDEFVTTYLAGKGGGHFDFQPLLTRTLEEGHALLLLDGLDEIQSPRLRQFVVDQVADFFTFHQEKGNKFVLTSRIVGYREVRPATDTLTECTLVDFTRDDIVVFAERWTRALEESAQGENVFSADDAERDRIELLAAVDRNAGVRV